MYSRIFQIMTVCFHTVFGVDEPPPPPPPTEAHTADNGTHTTQEAANSEHAHDGQAEEDDEEDDELDDPFSTPLTRTATIGDTLAPARYC